MNVNQPTKSQVGLGLKSVSEREWGRKGKETMGFATPNGLLPLRALAGTAKKRKLEAEASDSNIYALRVCTNSI